MSETMIVNWQIRGRTPLRSFAVVKSSESGNDWARTVDATCFRMSELEQERYQCWADLTGLRPSSSYTVQSAYIKDRSSSVITYANIQKFRTAPSLQSGDPITFVDGGDVEMSDVCDALCKASVQHEPLFAVVAGDISYGNGLPACYMRWDSWFRYWETHMTTPEGYTVPILTAVGNHEADNFRQPRASNGFYIRYFPHQVGLQELENPQDRPLQHTHLFGNHTAILIMDTEVHDTVESQVPWLRENLEKVKHLKYKIPIYHAAVYPSSGVCHTFIPFNHSLRTHV